MEQNQIKPQAKTLAETFQSSRCNVEGRNGHLLLRNHQLRGLVHPRKQGGLTAVHSFFLTRTDVAPVEELLYLDPTAISLLVVRLPCQIRK